MKTVKKSLKAIGVVLILLLTTKISYNQIPSTDTTGFELFKYKTLYYKILKPINFDVNKKYPVVICLHGAAQMDNDTIKFSPTTYGKQLALPQVRLEYPAYIIVPKTSKLWDLNDLTMLKDIIAGLPSVDMSRIYILGHSAGGQGTLLFIETEPQYFAAAIACSAYGNRVKNRQGLINFNLWSMHGDADNTVPYDKDYSFFNDMKALKARMKFTTYFGFTHGKTDEYIFGINGIDSTVTPLNANQFKTEFAGPDSDPETNTLKWMFSKKTESSIISGNNTVEGRKYFFPNPTKSIICWSETLDVDRVIVYNLNGLVVLKSEKNNSIDLSKLENGMYFLRLYRGDQLITNQKVIKE